ncbi:MAG: SpoIIIAH-like family protein [Firmicutes bacterium]|nr:SpoIIIAH-like family protein [Bacillota bacterium]
MLKLNARGRKIVRFVAFAVLVVGVVWYVSLKRVEVERRNLGQPVNKETAAKTTGTVERKDFYNDYRLTRERTRSQQLDLYREIINNTNAEPSARKEANQVFLKMTHYVGKEAELENLIKARGFEDAIVSLYENTAVVMVKAKEISQADAAKIADIVSRGANIKPEQVSIVPKP